MSIIEYHWTEDQKTHGDMDSRYGKRAHVKRVLYLNMWLFKIPLHSQTVDMTIADYTRVLKYGNRCYMGWRWKGWKWRGIIRKDPDRMFYIDPRKPKEKIEVEWKL